jgi:uncharacterized protein (TIGR00730 family)
LLAIRGDARYMHRPFREKNMATLRLSGTVLGPDDPNRASRARLLYLLFAAGWDIYNANGDQRITLTNIEKKIIESDAFVFTPGATLEDMFKAISIFVGFQTLDGNLAGKPTIILNEDRSWNPLFAVLSHLRKMGTVLQNHADFLLTVDSPEAVLDALERVKRQGIPDAGRHPIAESAATILDAPVPDDYIGNACVFCSASLEDPRYLADGEALGRILAENRIGCVSGAGRSGIMGAVVKGSVNAGGWTGGSNVPHIIQLEGLPDGLSSLWLRPDIYTRMQVMIENSDAFIIFPGGAGTVQELLALMIFKHQKNPLMEGKPVVIFNREHAPGLRFWDPLIELLGSMARPGDFVVADALEDLLPAITPGMKKLHAAKAE